MPSHGIRITNNTHRVLAPPPMSLLRKMSPKTQNRHMIQAKNRKNSNRARRNEPLSSNIGQPFGRARVKSDLDPRCSLSQPANIHHAGVLYAVDETIARVNGAMLGSDNQR